MPGGSATFPFRTNDLGDVQRRQGDLEAALESYRSGMAIREKLAESDPSSAGWQDW